MLVFRSLALAAALLVGGLVQAQECALSLSGDDIDYGSLNRTTLKAVAGQLSLPPRSVYLSLQCTREQAMRLSYRALAASAEAFRFGDQGHYQLWLSDAQLDGRTVQLGQADAAASGAARAGREMPLLPEQVLVAMQNGQALVGQRLKARVEVRSGGPEDVLRTPQTRQWLAHGSLVGNGTERELRLRAEFTPAACTPRLGQGGVVDFGRITSGQLALAQPTLLQRSLALNIQCDGPTRFALVAKDNRAGTALALAGQDATTLFGIGNTRAGTALGAFRLRIDQPSAERPLTLLVAAPAASAWHLASDHQAALAHNGRQLGFVREGEGSHGPSALSELAAQVQLDLYLAPLQQLKLKEETPIQGSATLEIIYL